MRSVDLRSDTVTTPTPQMREAMYRADVGDDVYGEDPTVNELEKIAAQMTGKQNALFVASGTMGNQLAVMVHCARGDEVICEADSHIFYYEVGGLAYLAGVQARTVVGEKGIISPGTFSQAMRSKDIHQPQTALLCIENTHNRAGGTCYKLEDLAAVREVAVTGKIPIHMDGARVFNAAVARGVAVAEIAQYADSLNLCLSKGLGAPVGSLLLGEKDFIDKARRYRKMLGGGMRQAGILAAAGIVAITTMGERLIEDHENAQILANAIAEMGFSIDMTTVQTNIVVFNVSRKNVSAASIVQKLSENGIKANQFSEETVRMVTHFGITRKDIDYTIDVMARIMQG